MIRALPIFCFLLLAVLLAAGAPGTQPATQDDPRARIRGTVEMVVVPVTVKDASGELLYGLRREEFRVFEDGVEQEIELFSADAFPLSAVVLVDNALGAGDAQRVQESLGALAAGFAPSDEVAVALYETFLHQPTEFFADNDALYDALRRIELAAPAPGRTGAPLTGAPRVDTSPGGPPVSLSAGRRSKHLHDALYGATELLRSRARDRRRIILVVSDGANARENTVTFDRVLERLLAWDIVVYGVVLERPRILGGPGTLENYAQRTGGEMFYPTAERSPGALYALVTEQARNAYTLGYVPRNTDRTLGFHSIEVRVRRPNLIVKARDGYFAVAAP